MYFIYWKRMLNFLPGKKQNKKKTFAWVHFECWNDFLSDVDAVLYSCFIVDGCFVVCGTTQVELIQRLLLFVLESVIMGFLVLTVGFWNS